MGFSELAKEAIDAAAAPELTQAETSKVRGYLDMIESASLRARNLSRGIWNFAKAEPGTTANIDVVELMDTVQQLTTPAVKVAQIDIARHEDPTGVKEAISYTGSALCQQILVELVLASSGSIPGGGLVVWQIFVEDDGSVKIDLVTEPWNEDPTKDWVIPEYVRDSFIELGGSIAEAEPTPVMAPVGDTQLELTGWRVVATLPPARPE
jgi:hypothetical protein